MAELEHLEGPARARTLAAAAAHRRVKRALGLLREAAKALAPELADVDVVGELSIPSDRDADEVLELLGELVGLARARARDRDLDVVLLSSPRTQESQRG